MAQAIIGGTHVFTALFLDQTNTPVVVTDPTIEVLRFDDNGTKDTLVVAGTSMVIVPGETGRYQYVYSIPDTLARGSTLYAVMQGIYALDTLLVEGEVDLISEGDAGPGLTACFVK